MYHSALLAVAALACYLLLGQNALHGFDVYQYLRHVHEGDLRNPLHVLYLPTAWLWSSLLELLGVPLFEALRALSALAAAAGVFFCHRAAAVLVPGRAILVATGCAATPAVLHFATTVEIDALLFACAGLAWWSFAHLVLRERWHLAAATGACCALAAGFHAAGHLLAAMLCFLNIAWHFPRRRIAPAFLRSLAIAATHASLTLLLAWIARAEGQATMASNTMALTFRPDILPHIVWHEWLLPYLPFCALAFAALRLPRWRTVTIAIALCLLGYLAITDLILGPLMVTGRFLPQGAMVERGSFLLALTLPAALLTALALPRAVAWLAVAAALIAGVLQVRINDWEPDPPRYASGLQRVLQREPLELIAADARERAWVVRRLPDAPCITVAGIELVEIMGQENEGVDVTAALVAAWFDLEYKTQQATGRSLMITPRALERMRASRDPRLRHVADVHLPQRYALEPVVEDGFRAFRLRLP